MNSCANCINFQKSKHFSEIEKNTQSKVTFAQFFNFLNLRMAELWLLFSRFGLYKDIVPYRPSVDLLYIENGLPQKQMLRNWSLGLNLSSFILIYGIRPPKFAKNYKRLWFFISGLACINDVKKIAVFYLPPLSCKL